MARIETCELLVSELVTNAVRAYGMPEEPASYTERHERLRRIKLRLILKSDSVVIEVWDGNPRPPVLKEQQLDDAEGGRGLLLVEQLSMRWGVYFPKAGGKVVWCEVRE
jgi:anti-sigma regulatory factor (Ser/Thr protein kinase)